LTSHSNRLILPDETWLTTTLVRTHGYAPSGQRLQATVLYGHWNRTTFVAYLNQVLFKEVRAGGLSILDNLLSHKTPAAVVAPCTCPYSPDLNPIGSALSKLERVVRGADGPQAVIGQLIDLSSPAACRYCLRHWGHPDTIT